MNREITERYSSILNPYSLSLIDAVLGAVVPAADPSYASTDSQIGRPKAKPIAKTSN